MYDRTVVHACASEGFDPRCAACGEPIDYCRGHGQIGDPYGHTILWLHDHDDHERCHPNGCDVLRGLSN